MMLSFALPLGLLFLVVVAIPVILHLRAKPIKNVIKVGLLAQYKPPKPLRVTNLALQDVWLLLLRILLIIIACMVLSGALTERSSHDDDEKVFVSENWLRFASDNEIDTLLSEHNGQSLWLLTSPFRQLSATELRQVHKDKFAENDRFDEPSTMLLNRYYRQHDDDAKATFYLTNLTAEFASQVQLVHVPESVSWRKLDVSSRISNVGKETTKAVKIVYSSSRLNDARLLAEQFSDSFVGELSDTTIEIELFTGFDSIAQITHHDVKTLMVLLLKNDVTSANAFRDKLLERLNTNANSNGSAGKRAQWIVLLDSDALSYDGSGETTHSRFTLANFPFSSMSAKTIASKYPNTLSTRVLWQSQDGTPVLTADSHSGIDVYQLFFALDQNSLQSSRSVTAALRAELIGWRSEQRIAHIDVQAQVMKPKPTASALELKVSLREWLMLLFILVLAAERLLSARSREWQ